VENLVQSPPDGLEGAADAAKSVRARGAGKLHVFEYTDGATATSALPRDALNALGRSESALAMRSSPLAHSVRARTEPPSVDRAIVTLRAAAYLLIGASRYALVRDVRNACLADGAEDSVERALRGDELDARAAPPATSLASAAGTRSETVSRTDCGK
jgi:hypothetical protein